MPAPRLLSFAVLVSTCLTACQEPAEPKSGVAKSPGAKTSTTSRPDTKREAVASPWSGKVKETMNSGGYTYVLMDTGTEKKWVAGPKIEGLTVGQSVSVTQPMTMRDFNSGSLKRQFPLIYFVSAIHTANPASTSRPANSAAAKTPEKATGKTPAADPEKKAEPLAKVEGGLTVAEVFAQRKELDGKVVKVRGRVVKFMSQIMGTNWLHIEDGTGSGDTARLRVTTDVQSKVGEVVIAEGTVAADKDFGSGYSYTVLIEKAKITKE